MPRAATASRPAAAQDEFGNEGCTYTDQDQVPLNDYERANVRVIQSIEKRRGC